ncbi:MAG: Cu+-exporting ATPase [Verrucomicrobia bacterium]|jgi:Cu+-exporting ATPase|nr:Cu+-exporting ATPase [Verrucomicrobiota bacterium]
MNVKTELKIDGMTCQNCARNAGDALRAVPGVTAATVDLANARATVTWSENTTPAPEALLKAVETAGYQPSLPETETSIMVSGMDCQSCVGHVTKAAQTIPGVAHTKVDLATGRVTIDWQPNAKKDLTSVVSAIQKAGYEAKLADAQTPSANAKSGPLSGWKFNVVVGGSITSLLMFCEWVLQLGMNPVFHWFAFALALPVQILCGARFYRGAWNQLKQGKSNMDTLVALGSTTAFVYSLWGLLAGWHGHLYFMESAGIITLVSVGHWLEALMSERAASSLKALVNLAPPTALRMGTDGKETTVDVAQLQPGDRVRLRPGDRVPVDGEVIEGGSAVNESMLTGESLPVDKQAGSALYTGTLVENGQLLMRVTKTGSATALAQIIAVVERAQNSRASIQKLGDQISSIFVPVVVCIALAAAAWWGLAFTTATNFSLGLAGWLWPIHLPDTAIAAAVLHAAAVLIIACPCAMGLATPAAIMAGTNAAAQRGILIRDGAALEKSGTITAVIFDKTGTLTEGKPTVVASEDLRSPNAAAKSALKDLASALASPSNHPLSRAITTAFGKAAAQPVEPGLSPTRSNAQTFQPLPSFSKATVTTPVNVLSQNFTRSTTPQNWTELRGKGIEAILPEHATETLRLGSLRWLQEIGVDTKPAEAFSQNWMNQGASVLAIAEGQRLIGVIALRDVLKPKAAEVIHALQNKLGKAQSVYLLTGDAKVTAEALAREAGIAPENVFAEVRPEQKAELVKQLQAKGERVAFVGDGINDAPALEQADLGIAVALASDVAREAADIILLKSDIQAIPEAIGLAQATLRTIKQNLFWAFFYNAAAIPLAALGFLSPLLCAAAMGLSDVVVIGNALRLRRWKG